MSPARSLHPLLLEPTYWRGRVRALEERRPGIIWTPRPDLSAAGVEVLEFRAKALDGAHLRGLLARSTWRSGSGNATLRTVRPASRLEIDLEVVRERGPEILLQEGPGRPLADRVLDVVTLCHLAVETEGVDRIEVDPTGRPGSSDAVVIAQQLLAQRIVSPSVDDPRD